MERLIQSQLLHWFEQPHFKPLILKGARQVGKTHAVNTFGQTHIAKKGRYHYFDLKKEEELALIFQGTKDPRKILEYIELKKKIKINPSSDLLFWDEIQDCPGAISALKYFEQDMSHLHIIAAGSHLGLVKHEESFPVGKVQFLSMFPMTFYEFVWALEDSLCPLLNSFNVKEPEIIASGLHQHLLSLLLQYFAVGGLPEAVATFKSKKDQSLSEALKAVRTIQHDLLIGYEADFSKYSGTVNANHIHSVFRAIPKQLSKSYDESVPKFKFSGVIPNQKGFDRIIGPLSWLSKSRLCIKSNIVKQSGHPLLSFSENNLFKVYFLDVGLLNAALDTPMEAILLNELSSYKGFIVENFVAQELFAALDKDLIAWQEGQSEIEFLVTQGLNIIPIEAKAGTKSRKAKSLDSYIQKYHPKFAYKVSAQNSGNSKHFNTIPLYLTSKIIQL